MTKDLLGLGVKLDAFAVDFFLQRVPDQRSLSASTGRIMPRLLAKLLGATSAAEAAAGE